MRRRRLDLAAILADAAGIACCVLALAVVAWFGWRGWLLLTHRG